MSGTKLLCPYVFSCLDISQEQNLRAWGPWGLDCQGNVFKVHPVVAVSAPLSFSWVMTIPLRDERRALVYPFTTARVVSLLWLLRMELL